MAKVKDETPVESEDNSGLISNDHVQYHLDRDPNDVRKAGPTPQLPSLDDESQQTPENYKGVTG